MPTVVIMHEGSPGSATFMDTTDPTDAPMKSGAASVYHDDKNGTGY